jgi:hypothetical protein
VTALLCAGLIAVVVLMSTVSGAVASAVSARSRAQLAADAAALAAIAEVSPYGGNAPLLVARRYAELNGADLIECLCDSDASAMQVTVELNGARASARAVIDTEMLSPTTPAAVDGLHPELEAALDRLVQESRGRVWLVSGLRSSEHQALLWEQAVDRYGSAELADDWVAPPGSSMHERGLAVDLGGDLGLATALIEKLDLPLWRPMEHEPWHFELVGSR